MFFLSPPQVEPLPQAAQEAPADADGESFSDLFEDEKDGAFDASRFLSSQVGFLPIVMPVTEPAVGYGAAAGLMFFHDKPTVKPMAPGEPTRLLLPSITGVFGMATENGSWAAGMGHLGMWNDGRVRYAGGVGYGSLELDWFGRGDSFDHSVDYRLDAVAVVQQLNFQLGESDFFAGLRQRLFVTNANFDLPGPGLDILPDEFQSKTSGLGVGLAYDTRDNPFCPRHGIVADATVLDYGSWLGGDFDYVRLETCFMQYVPLGEEWAIGARLDGQFSSGDVPFYDLARLNMRGVSADQFMDDDALLVETELRWDFVERWSLVGFGGLGRVAGSLKDLGSADNVWSGGAGFRYLIARQFGLRMGIDVARGPDDTAVYITIGTGWFRP